MSTVTVCEQALLPNYLLIGNSFSYSSQPFNFARMNETFQISILSEGGDRPKSTDDKNDSRMNVGMPISDQRSISDHPDWFFQDYLRQ